MLQDRHLLWDENWVFETVSAMVQSTLKTFKANQAFWLDEKHDWCNAFALAGMEYGVNPGWLLTCAQRERSLAGSPGIGNSFRYALGVVGQDGPGTAFPRYNGFPSQVTRAARITTWHLGTDWQPRRAGLVPSHEPRWNPAGKNFITLKDDLGQDIPVPHLCSSRAELAQLRFTPHLKVLAVNESIMRDFAPLFFR